MLGLKLRVLETGDSEGRIKSKSDYEIKFPECIYAAVRRVGTQTFRKTCVGKFAFRTRTVKQKSKFIRSPKARI